MKKVRYHSRFFRVILGDRVLLLLLFMKKWKSETRHVNVVSFRDPTRQVGRLQVQGLDTSCPCHLTGARHHTSLPPTRVQYPLCGYPSASFYFLRFVPLFLFRRRGFFSSPIHRIRHTITPYIDNRTLDTSPTGAFGRNGSHGEST
jgi:hypothetical protein